MKFNRRDFLKLGATSAIGFWLDTILPKIKAYAGQINEGEIPEMIYRPFGNTGKELSILGMGGARYPYNDGDLTEAVKLAVRAYELGINYFETGPQYVQDKCEEILGLALKEIERKNKNKENPLPCYWGTKSGLYLGDETAGDVRHRLETSLKRIGKDKVPFYYMWAIMDRDHYQKVMKKGGPYEGALKAKEEGLIDHIIYSTHASGEENVKIINDGAFDGVLLGYNITNFPRQEKAVQAAYEKGMGVLTMNPLAGGLIPRNAEYFEQRIERENTDMTIVQTALAFIMGQPEITVALSGMDKEEYIVENIKTINFLKIFSDNQLAGLKEKYLEDLQGICTTCQYCDVCPQEIPIYAIMRAYNSYILNGKQAFQGWARWYKGLKQIDFKKELEKCTKCGSCEKVCTQHLDIIKRFDKIKNELLT